MNLIYGCATTLPENKYFQLVSEEIEKNYRTKIKSTFEGMAKIQSGYISNYGAVLGIAKQDSLSLIYVGVLQKPLTGWNQYSPSDDPDVTAQYLLSRYNEHNIKFLDNIFGHYSIAICNHRENRLILACDPGGVSTLYYTETGHSLIFCNNVFSIASALKDTCKYDRSLEDFFLVYGFFPWNRLPFKGINPLSGAILEWHDGHKEIHVVEKNDPWQKRFSGMDFDKSTENEVIDLLYDAFMVATEEQSASSERAAVLLGGVDSALVASALNRLGKKVETFSFFYDNAQFNQTHTDTLAEYLDINHNWIRITEETIRNGLQTFSLKFNRPTNWPNYLIQTEYLCTEIRKRGILNCYTGDGCDHLFLGYPRTHIMSKLFISPLMMPKVLLKLVLYLAQWSFFEYYLGRTYQVALSMLRNFAREKHVRGHIYFSVFDEISLKRLRDEPPPDHEMDIEAILNDLSKGLKALSPDRLTYHGKSSVSANKEKMLGSSNSSGISILSPYLHPGMSGIAKQLPDRYLRPEKKTESSVIGKYILMKMAEKKQLLPREVIYQKKIAAVDAPIDDWYAGPLKRFMMETMQGLPFKCNKDYIKHLLTPKLAEEIYKKYISSDHLTSHGISLLATYASFTRALKKHES